MNSINFSSVLSDTMGKYDKDRFQKELAIRYCLAQSLVPFLEVIVPSASDISDSVEVLTDIDVLGVESVGDGGLRRVIFDCKTANKMSSVNRAFWAAGVKAYTKCDDAYVILKTKAVHNHRFSALVIGVDLHDENSFKDLGATVDASFPADDCYQSSIDRWNAIYDQYQKNEWAAALFDQVRNAVPLTQTPWKTFRRVIAELRALRGQFDPAKSSHVSIFLDVLASTFVLWAGLGRDIRRFYEPTMSKTAFEKTLRYYLWGGKEAYNIRQQLRHTAASQATSAEHAVELPAWEVLLSFAGLIVSAPQNILGCANICRELSMKVACGADAKCDSSLAERLAHNTRARQFSTALSDYLVTGAGLPKDLGKEVQSALFAI